MSSKTVNNVTLHYEDRGRGIPLVFVHGFPVDSRMWAAQVEALSDRYRVIAPDLRGFGRSVSAQPFSMISLADDLHTLLDQIGALPCVLAGFSMGGYVALAYAKKYPGDLLGIALIDSKAEGDNPAGKENRNKMIQTAREKGAVAIAEQMMPKMVSPQTPQKRPDVARKLKEIMESQLAKTIEHALAAMRDREDHSGNLASIAAPVLIVVGQDDALTPPAVAEAMSKAIPKTTLRTISDAGHISPMEQPDGVTGALREFLEGIAP